MTYDTNTDLYRVTDARWLMSHRRVFLSTSRHSDNKKDWVKGRENMYFKVVNKLGGQAHQEWLNTRTHNPWEKCMLTTRF